MLVIRLLLASVLASYLAACQTTGSTGSTASFTTNSTPRASAFMAVGREVVAPFGYIGFCQRNPGDCEKHSASTPQPFHLTEARWRELVEINDQVNQSVRPVEDRALYNREEWWTYPAQKAGDCEDYALLKRKLLLERGWPQEALLISVVKEWSGSGHAVLLASTDNGEFVLDNQNWEIVNWQDAPYTWIKRQSQQNPFAWVSIATPYNSTTATASQGRSAPREKLSAWDEMPAAPNTGTAPRTITSAMAN